MSTVLKRALSDPIQIELGKVCLPKKDGWYLVDHEQDDDHSWISCEQVLAFWGSGKWLRPCGWPARSDGQEGMTLANDCQINLPPCSQVELLANARRIKVINWRGVILV